MERVPFTMEIFPMPTMGLITGGGPYNGFIRPGPYINQNFQFFGTWVGLISDIRPGPYMRGNTVVVCTTLVIKF